jgi:O-antigen ligase
VFYELKSRIKNKELGMRGRGFYLSTLVLGLAALTLSFSRSAWVVGGLGILGAVGFRWFRWFRGSRCLSLLSTLSFLRRAELNWIALEMLKDHSLLGVGLNNFTVAMDNYGKVSGWTRFLQPVHNVYLLVVTETGLIGLIVFLCLLFSIFRLLWEKKNYLLFVSMVQIALLCSVDHYFFTLQQTSLLFWLIVGLVFSTVDKV